MLFSARSDPLLDGQRTSLDKLGLPFPVPDASSPAWPVVVAQQELRGRNSCHLNLWCDTVLWKWVSKDTLPLQGSVCKFLFNLAFS